MSEHVAGAVEMAKRHPWWILGGLVVGLLLLQMMRGSSAPVATTGSALSPDAAIIAANNALQAEKDKYSAAVAAAQTQADAQVKIAGIMAENATAQNAADAAVAIEKQHAQVTLGLTGALSNIFGFGQTGAANVSGAIGSGSGGSLGIPTGEAYGTMSTNDSGAAMAELMGRNYPGALSNAFGAEFQQGNFNYVNVTSDYNVLTDNKGNTTVLAGQGSLLANMFNNLLRSIQGLAPNSENTGVIASIAGQATRDPYSANAHS